MKSSIRAVAIAGLALVAIVACEGPNEPALGTMRIILATSGADLDPDGYTVLVDTTPARSVALNGTLTVSALPAGSHTVALTGLSVNCAVVGDSRRAITVRDGDTVVVRFDVRCGLLPAHSALQITTATTGTPGDPDGYAACVDPAPDGSCAYGGPFAIAANGGVTAIVDTGVHIVQLMGVASNCQVNGDNPRWVHDSSRDTVVAQFNVDCGSVALHVTTTTTGVQLDPDGYELCVDPYYDSYGSGCATFDGPIGSNGAATVPATPGSHSVELDGVAGNCTVSGDNPRTVTPQGTAEVPFTITCVATGSVHVTVATTGTDVDPDGYTVCIDGHGSGCYWSTSTGTNASLILAGVIAGPHTVTLNGVAGNCTVGGGSSRSVTVPSNGTVDLAFDVGCVLAERIAFSSNGTISVIQADGSGAFPITLGLAPAWSPDGSRIAYECGQDICAINADRTSLMLLTVDGAANRHPAWSPDGSKIAFAATHAGVTDLYVMAANGSGVVRLTQNVGFVGSPAWSHDGTKIAFDCRVDIGNDDICVVNADGTGLARLTTDPARDYGAAWKPDGSTLAFATTRYGSDEVALLNPAGGTVTRVGAGLPGFAPSWSPDGAQLAFVQEACDSYGCSYAVQVAHADGSNVHYVTLGNQPAWKPHS